MSKKAITFVVPCYNSAAYMDKCIRNLVALNAAGNDIEILVVDDGSDRDDTLKKARQWAKKYPQIVRAIHKKNGGHGSAVNKGLEEAKGLYFKVVDSDDWLDVQAMQPIMEYLRKQTKRKNPTDLVIGNYMYEKLHKNEHTTIKYTKTFPEKKEFGWNEVGKFKFGRYLLMHSVIYRTAVLREAKLQLPEHTFYVDNIFVYVPLPFVKTIYYIDADIYRYQIGRDDQSVNEEIMKKRIDQQLLVTRLMIDKTNYQKARKISPRLAQYQVEYLSMMMCICSAFLRLIGTKEAEQKRQEIWVYLRRHNEQLYRAVRRMFPSYSTNIPGPIGKWICTTGYRVMQKIFKFN